MSAPLACQDVAGRVATRYSDHRRAIENQAIRDNLQLARETRGEHPENPGPVDVGAAPGGGRRDLEAGVVNRPVQVPASNSSARKAAAEKFAYRPEDQFSIHVPETTALTIKHPDGRDLFVIHRDGTVTGDIEDAGEDAAIFVREVKRLFGGATDTAAPEGCPRRCGRNEPCPDPWHDSPAAPEPCIAPPGNLCTDTGCWDADRCVVSTPPAARVAVEGVETVEWGASDRRDVRAWLIREADQRVKFFPQRRDGVDALMRHLAASLSPVEPETSEPESGESRG